MNITEYYITLLEQFRTVKMAEHEFRRQMEDDPELHESYIAWCHENELNPREALRDFGEQYMEDRESRWDVLNDFDELN